MGYFPFFADIENSTWVIAGGGRVALRKAMDLLPFGASICVISPEFVPQFYHLAQQTEKEKLFLIKRTMKQEDLKRADFLIAATNDSSFNYQISIWCREQRIPVNVTDQKELCSFLFPSILKDGPVVVGISTGGNSPILAGKLKNILLKSLPSGVGKLAVESGIWRKRMKDMFPDAPKIRCELLREITDRGLEQKGDFPFAEAEKIIKRRLEHRDE